MSGTSRRRWRRSRIRRFGLHEVAAAAGIFAALLAFLSFLGVGPIQFLPHARGPGLSIPPPTMLIQPAPTTVPGVSGLLEAHAVAALRHAGFVVRIQYTPATNGAQVGVVIGQAPIVGTPLRSGATVVIVVGTTA